MFIKNLITKLPYFQTMNKECVYDAIFCMKHKSYQENDIILKAGERADKIIFIEKG